MRTEILLQPLLGGRMVGIRSKAVPVRHEIESALMQHQEVVLDFRGLEVTQSFVDELVGHLILTLGPSILARLVFQGCSPAVKAIVQFVATDRADQFSKAQ